MDLKEHIDDPQESTRAALDGLQGKIWTTIPGIVQSFDPVAITISVQPAIQGRTKSKDGVWSNNNLPLLVDVPVVWQGGGGYWHTYPIEKNDEAVIYLSARDFSAWWQQGGVQPVIDYRMHDLSDGFAIVGPQSQPRAIKNISTTTTQLRDSAGTNYIELDKGGIINLVANQIFLKGAHVYTSDNLSAGNGASGSFTTTNGSIVTVMDGIITNIS